MKNHRILSITQKQNSEISPQALAFAVAETMKGAVKSIITESMFPDMKETSARHLYFGKSQLGSSSRIYLR